MGFDRDHCTEAASRAARAVGAEIARRGLVLVTGGLGGVMEAASSGAKEAGGFVVGIVPQDNMKEANGFCDVVIPTGMGYARDFITAYSGDAVIVVGGGAGTLIEVAAAYQKRIPVVAVKGTGGIVDQLVGSYIDDRKLEQVVGEKSPEQAVSRALALLENIS